MICLIIGGNAQGKLNYALKNYKDYNVVDCSEKSPEISDDNIILYNFHEYIKLILREKKDIKLCIQNFVFDKNNIVIICNEIGCGIVPMDSFERGYRETVGRICTLIADRADTVIRIYCGIPNIIKG